MNKREAFLLGVGTSGFITMLMAYCIAANWELREKKQSVLLELCQAHNTLPFSYDTGDVTCDNGLGINYSAVCSTIVIEQGKQQ